MNKKQEQDNRLYNQYRYTIDSIQNALKREIPHLIHDFNLTIQQVDMLNEYINDRLTMFRYLHKNSYSLPTTLSLLLDTIRWRLTEQVDTIRLASISHTFLNEPLIYFHKRDKLNRPVLIIQLAYLPILTNVDDMTEFLSPLVIFVLETARLLLCDLAMSENAIYDMNVLIDFKNASSLPTDLGLLKSLVGLLQRYPGLTGTVNLIHFGWMYQGLWQMCKLVLSSEAKSKVNFPAVKDIKTFIDKQNLITELGGNDPFQWELSKDIYFIKYRQDLTLISSLSSRCSSSSSIYYDIINEEDSSAVTLFEPTSSFSLYDTPVSSHTNLTNSARAYSTYSLQTKLGPPRLRNTIKQLGDLFVIPSQQHDVLTLPVTEQPSLPPTPPRERSWFVKLILKLESRFRLIMLNTVKRLSQYKGALYWIIAGLLLRHGVQEICQHVFLMMMEVMLIGKPNTTNTIGLRSRLGLTAGQMTL